GLSTGILTTFMMFFMVWIIGIIQPNKVPGVTEEDRKISFRDRMKSLQFLLPIALLFFLIIGGSFFGWFHPTVGGAVGAGAVLIYALFKRVPVRRILRAAWESAHIFAGTYLIIVSGTMFSRMISLSGLTGMLVDAIERSNFSPYGVIFSVLIVYLIAGCVMDILAVIVVTVPVFFPILTSLGFDPYILCMIVVLSGCIGGITPPIGVAAFTISNVTGVPTQKIFQGVWPFVVSELLVAVLIILFPQIVSWLPTMLAALK
ncbi:MAG: TRAP transporter large permease subunit, partial [Oscillospiraceae bacterium]|nr:TRAP transporter large permease subunit [Oscillospiraceae bacterium]